MKLRNPAYVSPVQNFINANKAAIDTWLKSRPNNVEWITAAQLRTQFPALAAELTDGMIAEVCKALNLPTAE